MDLLECMRVIKSKVQGIYAVVNVEQSSLHRIAKQSIMLECGTEKAVATTKAFLSKIIRLFELFSSQAHQQSKAEWSIELIHTAIKQILEKNTIETVKKCAKMVQNVSHLYILGKGTSYVSALEMALKIKEVAYIHAEAFRISEFKHGPIALIENNSVCLVLAPDDQQFEQAE